MNRMNESNLHIVELHVSIVRPCEKLLRVGAKSQGSDWHGMTFQCVQKLLRLQFKDFDDAINVSTGQVLAIWGDCDGESKLSSRVECLFGLKKE